MVIYTHVDPDYFTPTSDEDPIHLSRPHMSPASTHITAGIHALPSHCLHSDETLPRSSSGRIHERLSREDPVEFMSILAAVDLDTKSYVFFP